MWLGLTLEEGDELYETLVVVGSVPLWYDDGVVLVLGRVRLVGVEHDDRIERSVQVGKILDHSVRAVLSGGERLEPGRVSVQSVRHVGRVRVELLGDRGSVLQETR